MKFKNIFQWIITVLVLGQFFVEVAAAESENYRALKAEAAKIVQAYASQLKPKLLQALNTGGAVEAIAVCSEQAPAIAQQLSDESGWLLKRVSLKARNRSIATPDDWERQVLENFDTRRSQGEAAGSLVYAETVENEFRFMKAQPAEGLCLLCHGTVINEDVESALGAYYPDDHATGYSLGDIRGAFSLSKPKPRLIKSE